MTITVSSGHTSSHLTISKGDPLVVLSGGTIESSTIQSGGSATVSGSSFNNSVLSGGVYSVVSGGLSVHNTIESGGTEYVYGKAEFDTISSGATELIFLGGLSDVSLVDGTQDLYGKASGDVVSGVEANQLVEDGGSATSAVLSAHGFQALVNGGSAIGTTVNSTTKQIVYSGGKVTSTVVNAGGTVILASGATGVGLTVASGGFLDGPGTVAGDSNAAGTVSGVTFSGSASVNSFSTFDLLAGAVGSNITVVGNAVMNVSSGASATGTVVSAFANDDIHGTATSTTVGRAGGEIVVGGGEAVFTTVLNSGIETLFPGATGVALTVSAGGQLTGGGSLSGSSTVAGTVTNITVESGVNEFDELNLVSGGVANSVTATGAGYLNVQVGASATGTVLMDGGFDLVSGSTMSTTVSAAGQEYVLSGGEATSAAVMGGGTEFLSAGATGDSLTVSAGGVLDGPGDLTGSSTVAGTVSGAAMSEGGTTDLYELDLLSGGVASNVLVIGFSNIEVESGASATGTDVTLRGSADIHGSAISTLIGQLARATVYSGGHAISTTVNGGTLVVSSGASIIGGVQLDGGIETILSGAQVSGTVLSDGYEFDYGQASGTVIHSGGYEDIESGGKASGSIIDVGGHVVVSSGGLIDSATISAGATLAIGQDATASGTLTIAGGTLYNYGTAAWGQQVDFTTASGKLDLSDLYDFHAKISGMTGPGQQVDIEGFAYSASETASWSQTGTSGTLTVTDGAQKLNLFLIGSYATSDFKLSDDGHGGTFVVDPRANPAVPPPTRFAEAMAGFSGRDQDFAAVHAGGTALLSAGSVFTAATSGR
jgi:autotransporter passenger strand-loop-strand repeat protein